MKVVINKCFGGFGLSRAAIRLWCQKKGRACYFYRNRVVDGHTKFGEFERLPDDAPDPLILYAFDVPDGVSDDGTFSWKAHHVYAGDIPRDDPDLVAVVEELGDQASGQFAKLAVVEVPDGVEWEIDEYDGLEHVAEVHRTWR